MQTARTRTRNRAFAPLGIFFALLGLVLFAYFVRKVGVVEILSGIKRLGWGSLLILGFSCIRLVVRAIAWTLCFEAPHKLRFRDAFKARIIGDALGNLVPLGSMVISEPSKAVVVRDRVPLFQALSALTVENIFYSLSAALFVFLGTTALLLAFPLPPALFYTGLGALATTAIIIAAAFIIIRKQLRFLSGAVERLVRCRIGGTWLRSRRGRIGAFEDRIYGFYSRNNSRFLPIMLLEASFHIAGIAEIYVVLSFISEVGRATLLAAFILESVNRIITIVFKFMPLRTGIDEAGTGLLTKVLGLGTTIGVTLAILRKARDLFWTAVGFALLARRGLSPSQIARDTEAASDSAMSTLPGTS